MLTAVFRCNILLAEISDALLYNPLISAPSVGCVIKSQLLSWRIFSTSVRTTPFLCRFLVKTTAHIKNFNPHPNSQDSSDAVFLRCIASETSCPQTYSPFADLEAGLVSASAIFPNQAQRH